MKRLLICILAAVAVSACKMPEATFYASNCRDFLTVYKGSLVSDSGALFTVLNDATDAKWLTCDRVYAEFDVENINYDITLKRYVPCYVEMPDYDIPEEGAEGDFKDIISIADHSLGRSGYLNFRVIYTDDPTTDYPHRTAIYFKMSEDKSTLSLALFHDGNSEDIAHMDESALRQVESSFCFDIKDLIPEDRAVTIELYYYAMDSNKNVSRAKATLFGGAQVQF